jgi:hypothetical protein
LKSEATWGLPDAVWMTPTLMVPLLIPGPVHVAGDPAAAVVADAAPVAPVGAAVVLDDLLLLLLHAPAMPATTTVATVSRDLPRRTIVPHPPWIGAHLRARRSPMEVAFSNLS